MTDEQVAELKAAAEKSLSYGNCVTNESWWAHRLFDAKVNANVILNLLAERDQLHRSARIATAALETCQQLNAALREREKELRDAIEALLDHQNGCPLPSYEKGWNAAMKSARKALRIP